MGQPSDGSVVAGEECDSQLDTECGEYFKSGDGDERRTERAKAFLDGGQHGSGRDWSESTVD